MSDTYVGDKYLSGTTDSLLAAFLGFFSYCFYNRECSLENQKTVSQPHFLRGCAAFIPGSGPFLKEAFILLFFLCVDSCLPQIIRHECVTFFLVCDKR